MKKPYQIESQRAVKQLEAMAADGNPAVQMVLPMAEMLGWLRQGVGELIRQAGLRLMDLLMQEEVRELVGERSQRQAERTAHRWGSERGYCVVMGQKVPVERPRVRSTEDQEVRLGSYEMFHRGEPLTETVWEKLMLGLSTRKYGQAVREFTEAYGLEKSAVSEHFIEASRAKLQEMMERRLDKTRLCALLIDATPFAGQQLVVAMGISQDGRKMILGLRQGATENATVVGELLGDLVSRGLNFSEPRLYILDGGKALTAAVKKHAGESAAIQRCQVHKRRNVLDHLTDEQKPAVAQRLNAAYSLEDHAAAKQALNTLHRELMDLNPSAARSLGEGMEETLTVHRLHVPMQLRKTLASTNVIESAFSIVEQVCKNVKRWHGGDQRERWVGSGLLVAQKQFRKVTDINRSRYSLEN
jgi:putative transposase